MANSTWNFACDWRCGLLEGDGGFGPGAEGSDAALDPETVPFDGAITVVFAFMLRSGDVGETTNSNGNPQVLFSIGELNAYSGDYNVQNMADAHRFLIDVRNRRAGVGSETSDIRVLIKDRSGLGSMHYDAIFGDENGSDWLQLDKWYQVAVSAGPTAVHVYINGVSTMTKTVSANTMGDLNLNTGATNNRFWLNALATGQRTFPNSQTGGEYGHRSYITGPVMIEDSFVDLSSSTDRGRIFDSNGDLKNPGKNGSLWLSDTYDARVPLIYLPNGWVHRDFGRGGYTWKEAGTNSDAGEWAGLRKDYE